MPEISRFLGIVITMYFDEHPPPHFHATYGEYEISVDIRTGAIEGYFPKRAIRHVQDWLELYREELLEAWTCIENREPFEKIRGLE